jgi:hypothetical protein
MGFAGKQTAKKGYAHFPDCRKSGCITICDMDIDFLCEIKR